MDLLSREDLRELVSHRSTHFISVLMPTHHGADARQDPIRLKNLLEKVQVDLVQTGMRPSEAQTLLAPASRTLENSDLWRNVSSGLAMYIAPDFFKLWRVPLVLPAQTSVNSHFLIKPLLPLFAGGGMYFVLAVSSRGLRLLQCSPLTAREISLEHLLVPHDLAEVLKYDVLERQLQLHSGSSPIGVTADRGPVVYHGHEGYDMSVKKEELERFLLGVDRGLGPLLRHQEAPMVFAGVEYLFGLYRMHNSYANLVNTPLAGNPDRLSADELRRRAWEIVQPMAMQVQDEAAAHYSRAVNYGLASDNLRHVVPAAYAGRVGVLFANESQPQWGTYDPQTNHVTTHMVREPGDDDLTDLAIVHTLMHGGLVYSGRSGAHPTESPVAAIYRY